MLREQIAEYLLTSVLDEIGDELREAMNKHAPLNSAHEAYAVILEELDEFWDEVKKKREQRSKYAMRRELIQVAAMCVRTILDVGLTSE
jgi:glutamyl-tRNA reductase